MLVGQALSSFGDSALYLSLAIWAKDLTGSNAAAGAVFSALGLPMLFAPLAGQLARGASRRQRQLPGHRPGTPAGQPPGRRRNLHSLRRWGAGRAGRGHLRRRRGRPGQHPCPGVTTRPRPPPAVPPRADRRVPPPAQHPLLGRIALVVAVAFSALGSWKAPTSPSSTMACTGRRPPSGSSTACRGPAACSGA